MEDHEFQATSFKKTMHAKKISDENQSIKPWRIQLYERQISTDGSIQPLFN